MEITHLLSQNPIFPEGLAEVYKPPKSLYIRGVLEMGPAVAVVGTRRMTAYGRRCAELLVPELVRCGASVVSGLALGVDGIAHAVTLENGGRTVAVIGSGVDDASIYPRAHLGLARRIFEAGGAIVSEYPPGTTPRGYHFPERNRIIVGLSRAVLVVEAPKKSGAMITARLALDAGREVWAVPGPITSETSWGPNELIRNGATPICGTDDIAHALGVAPAPATAPDFSDLPADERAVAEFLRREPRTADEIARAVGLLPAAVGILLTTLELKGRIVSLGGGRFALYT